MAGAPLRLIVGLGNPGGEYRDTRHNAGFWFVDRIADGRGAGTGASLRAESKFSGEAGSVTLGGESLKLLKPLTYMNRSGQAVQQIAQFYKIAPAEMLIVHDELDLPPGTARFKTGGGHGGHNGLRDIAARLGRDFVRLRIGIGHPGERDAVSGYVLRKPPADQRELIERSIDDALAVLPDAASGQLAAAMNALHARQ